MSRIVKILFLSSSLFFFTSCSLGGKRTEMLNENEKEKEINRIDQIISLIENKDGESMKAIFSQTVLEEDENLENEIGYLFDFFQGEVVSCKDSGVGESETNEYGNKTKKVRSFYKIETDFDSYLVFLFEYTEDTNNSENLGVYSLRIIKEEDRDTQFTSWQDMVIPGIYMPEK